MNLLRWDAPGPYEVAFSTRQGGVSEGPFASLNLSLMTGDDPDRVQANRARLCSAIGANADRLALNRQIHSPTVNRAHAGMRGEPGDGLWTEEPNLPMLAMAADCLTIAVVRSDGERPALSVLHAGWRGLLEGVVAAAVASLGPTPTAAIVGPAIGPCCYEVGEEVAKPYRSAFGDDVVHGRRLDLWTCAERALRTAGCGKIERLDVCTQCNPELFFSERRTGKPRGTHGVIGYVA